MRSAAMDFIVRTVRRRDLYRCVVLDRLTHSDPWRIGDYRAAYRDEKCLFLVATLPAQFEFTEELVGVAVAELDGERLTFLRIVAHPEWQRCGIASGLFSIGLQTVTPKELFAECESTSAPHLKFWGGLDFTRLSDQGSSARFRR